MTSVTTRFGYILTGGFPRSLRGFILVLDPAVAQAYGSKLLADSPLNLPTSMDGKEGVVAAAGVGCTGSPKQASRETYGAKCGHISDWKRLRVKKVAPFTCVLPGVL